ncbi:MAG: GNAT family N-acetyltransferase, partial [Bacteroidota bacterium]|nr:GNAT family N-acetyltransferase [Bacteroidota bacterium]
MKSIITPIDKNVIRRELNDERFLRKTNKAQNEIYIINAHNAPNTMKEIGRLREVSFRLGGGGSGNEIDVDEFDFMEKPYQQIIVWNPDAEEIIGGYRFIHGKNVTLKPNGHPLLALEHHFKFSDEWVQNDLPHTMELSRAFVQPKY